MAKFSVEEWKKSMRARDEIIKQKMSEEELKNIPEHWLWSKKSIKRYNEVLEKLGRFKRRQFNGRRKNEKNKI